MVKDKIRWPFGRNKNAEEPLPLAIEGVSPAPLTPEPDDAELAAAALLEAMAEVKGSGLRVKGSVFRVKDSRVRGKDKAGPNHEPTRDAAYYRALADRIREAHRASALRATRFVAFCEQELKKKRLPRYGEGSLSLLEAELYKRIDIIDHEGGELKRRWQHCLAEVTVRLMEAPPQETKESPDGEKSDKSAQIKQISS